MITFDQFIYKYLGKKVDWDNFYGGQCVDLYRFYVKEVLGFPQSPGVGGAAEIWTSADPDYYDFIKNTPEGIPQKGDIVIWDRRAGGGFGHVAINISGGINEFISLDQNFPTLDKVTKTTHNYNSVIGWLRPKGQNESTIENNMQIKEILEKYKVKDLDELVAMMDKELDFLAGEREKTARLIQELEDQKNLTKAQTQALRESESIHVAYIQMLVEQLNPDPIEYEGVNIAKMVELEIDKFIERESALIADKSDLEKELDRVREDKREEVESLKQELQQVQDELGKKQGQLDNLSDRLEQLENSPLDPSPKVDVKSKIDKFIDWIAQLWKNLPS